MKKITDFFKKTPRESTPVLPDNSKTEKVDFKENNIQVVGVKTPKITRIEKRPNTPTSKKTSSKFVKGPKQDVVVIEDDDCVQVISKVKKTDSSKLSKIPLSERKSKCQKPDSTANNSRLLQKYTPPDLNESLKNPDKKSPEFVSLIPKESPEKLRSKVSGQRNIITIPDESHANSKPMKVRKLGPTLHKSSQGTIRRMPSPEESIPPTPSKLARRLKQK
ncbi:hypothetical protein HDV04_001839, partial [Boothiomyces sp. JEL0838]